MREIKFRETSADTEQMKYLTESKLEAQKTLICSKSRQGRAEPVEKQDSATLLLKSSKSLLQMHKAEN